MENRRQPPNPGARENQNNNNNARSFERRAPGAPAFQPRDNRAPSARPPFRNTDEKFQNRNAGFQPREDARPNDRFPPRDAKFQPRGRFAPKDKFVKPWEREKPPPPPIVSEMQITDGRHRGKHLTGAASPNVSMTARRVRETMFRILYRRVRAGRFLDLCAGTGIVGIEAISRGALIATFVERSARMCSVVRKNLETCGIKTGHGEVVQEEVVPFLKQMHKRKRHWDVVYFDPPRDANYDEVTAYLARGAAIKPKGVLIIEHHSEMFFPEKIGVLTRWRVFEQGATTLSFYERR